MKQIHDSKEVIKQYPQLTYLQLCTRGRIPAFRFPAHVLETFSATQVPVRAMSATGTNLSLAVEIAPQDLPTLCNTLSPTAYIQTKQDVCTLTVSTSSSSQTQSIVRGLKDLPLLILSCQDERLSITIRQSDSAQAAAYITSMLKKP